MRMVYELGPIVFNESGLAQAVLLLPEAASFQIEFKRPSDPVMGSCMHLVDAFRLVFRNGTSACVEGPYLWKFRESIPPAFGGDDVGYLDENPYGDGTTEDLLKRVRLVHDIVMRPSTTDDTAQPPLSVDVDCEKLSYRVTHPAELTDETQMLLANALRRRFAPIQAEVDAFAGSCLASMVTKGRCHYEFRPEPKYPTMLRNTQVFTPWPENAFEGTLDGLLGELCPMDTDWGPTPTLGARIIEWITRRADEAVLSIGGSRSAARTALCRDLSVGGIRGGAKPTPAAVLAAIQRSTNPTFSADVLYETWVQRSAGRPAREFLAQG
ncbi:MAG: hypothetical protein EPN36_13545 [Rhodanobacteraceae bacterium]|nr:MAG: hypothetical protein EPN36_13545 [Rhodanobacteraceae bacterium]